MHRIRSAHTPVPTVTGWQVNDCSAQISRPTGHVAAIAGHAYVFAPALDAPAIIPPLALLLSFWSAVQPIVRQANVIKGEMRPGMDLSMIGPFDHNSNVFEYIIEWKNDPPHNMYHG